MTHLVSWHRTFQIWMWRWKKPFERKHAFYEWHHFCSGYGNHPQKWYSLSWRWVKYSMIINLDVKISFSSEPQKRPMSFSTTPVFFWRCLLADWTASGFDKHDTFYKLMQHMDIATPSEQLIDLVEGFRRRKGERMIFFFEKIAWQYWYRYTVEGTNRYPLLSLWFSFSEGGICEGIPQTHRRPPDPRVCIYIYI